MLVLLLLLCGSPQAVADDLPPEDVAAITPSRALQAAKEAYVRGEYEAAQAAFLAVVQRAQHLKDVPPDIEADAWIYLGEMRLFEGDRRAAEASFRMALQRAPERRLSPVEHPDNVIGAFEVVRTAFTDELDQAASAPRKPLPWWGYAPFGAPQFRQRRPVRGGIYAVLQAGFAAASVAAWVVTDEALSKVNTSPSSLDADAARAQLEQGRLLRDAFSFTTAAAFYATWGISVADAGIAWRRDQDPVPRIAVAPMHDGAQVIVRWEF